jgi:hypothetical protein
VSDLTLLEAGALLAAPVGEASVPVSARAYTHPALDGRVVVRVVPEPLVGAEDLALDVLGLQPADATAIGHGRRRALGFPAWALINDPGNARHALALVQDLERGGRLARSRPGAAKDLLDGLAARLGRSAPHFLPTFLEQAGRAYLEAGNRTYAATMFAKARDAERVHALTIDEARQRDVFLEFAFAGALPAKALSDEARQLAARAEPADAHALFRRLCVERVAGGLPPYAGMAGDLRRLARAAGLDPAAEEESVVGDLLRKPATAASAAGFWRAYGKPLTRLARRDGTVAAELLRVFPRGLDTDAWVDLLEAAGAVDLLAGDGASAAAWLGRMAAHRAAGSWRGTPRSERLMALVGRLASALEAAGLPVDLTGQVPWTSDIDLLDVALDLGVPVADPDHKDRWLNVQRWQADNRPGRRGLEAVAADPRFGPMLRRGLAQALNRARGWPDRGPLSQGDLAVLIAAPGLRAALHDHLEQLADGAGGDAGLPGVTERLAGLDPLRTPHGLAVNAAAVARLAAVDAAEVLARTLRAGIIDELGWPALDQAAARMQPLARPGAQRLQVGDAWPCVTLCDGVTVVVVGPDGVLLEHGLRYPAGRKPRSWDHPTFNWTGGQLLIRWRADGKTFGYWSASPDRVFPCADVARSWSGPTPSLPLAGGGRTTGGRALHAGDTTVSAKVLPVAGDGSGTWRLEPGGGGPAWREFDPGTGSAGRRSLPSWFDEAAQRAGTALRAPHAPERIDRAALGARLRPGMCHLAPLPDGLAQTPLGAAGGLVGWRVVEDADGVLHGEGIDGRRASLPADSPGRVLAGLLRLPGGAELTVSHVRGTVLVHDAVGVVAELEAWAFGAYAAGTPLLAGPAWWHCLRPRDPEASRRLRKVGAADVAELLAAATEPVGGAEDRALDRLLPGCRDQALRAGVAGIARVAAGAATSARKVEVILAQPTEAPPEPGRREAGPRLDATDDVLHTALSGLTISTRYWYGTPEPAGPNALDQVAATGRLLTAEPAGAAGALLRGLFRRRPAAGEETDRSDDDWPATDVPWVPLVGTPAALLWRATSPVTDQAERAALLALLEALADAGLLGGPELRALLLTDAKGRQLRLGQVLRSGQATLVLVAAEHHAHHVGGGKATNWWAVEAGQRSGPVADLAVVDAEPIAGPTGEAGLRRAVAAARQRGPLAWDPAWVDRLVAPTGLSRAEAALLLAGLPGIERWDHNFLPKATRELLGLKATEAKAAQRALAALAPATRRRLLAAAVPAEPAQLLTAGPDIDGLASAFAALVGRRARVPDELLTAAGRALPTVRDPAAVVRGIADPAGCAWLQQDGDGAADLHYPSPDPDAFDGHRLTAVATVLPWLAYQLPTGEPLRSALPAALDALQARLASPRLRLAGGYDMAGTFRAALGLPGSTGSVRVGAGIEVIPNRWGQDELVVAPAALTGADLDRLRAVAAIPADGQGATSVGLQLQALLLLRSPGLAQLAARLAEPGLPAGRFDQDPTFSAPATVEAAAAELVVGQDAAALYLQVLALPDPTAKLVQRWNGWRAAAYKRAEAELVDAGHLVRATRARAGRASFLPGGWLPLGAPDLPVESWKASLLGIGPGDRPSLPLGRVLVAEPLGALFARAWARWCQDRPGLETLDTKAPATGRPAPAAGRSTGRRR